MPRGPEHLITITYPQIAELAGEPIEIVKAAVASRQMDSRDLDSTLSWINRRRTEKRLEPIGCTMAALNGVGPSDE